MRRATLSIGMTLPVGTTSIVAYMKYEGGTEVYFDDLKIELSAVPVAMVVQENHYYPFGLNMKGLDYTAPNPNTENKFTFNGQTEKETKLNLHWHETAFRSYDPQVGRFHQIDPLADLFTGINPYQFGYNNPIAFNDLSGLASEHFDEDGLAAAPTPTPRPAPKPVPTPKPVVLKIKVEQPTLKAKKDSWVDKWADSENIFAKMTYAAVDGVYVTAQTLNPFNKYDTHLTGEVAQGDDKINAFAETATMAVPMGKSGGVAKTALQYTAKEGLIGIIVGLFTNFQSHHLIPQALKNGKYGKDIVKFIDLAMKNGFKYHSHLGTNRMFLETYNKTTGLGIHASHDNYSNYVVKLITNYISKHGISNITPQMADNFLTQLANQLRGEITTLRNQGLSQKVGENLNTVYKNK
ncbi:RHS repeat-associated core domain-containing protein [Thermoflexibacter ruber]|uniref:RHS repeat-associated core domain-containing protein n=1 Tax=Thermoflexibacter ruber TaxID=1003 RepID=A0A1I2JAW6_9BACT|nr:RHS repeat-associated core domain-containing protein [Thermoflexibacter ruber]SFF51945.1 RHS repeat-associated core domain-containing protein [Thermoflexibacter ruber]